MNTRNISVTHALIIINILVYALGLFVRKSGALGLVLPWMDNSTSAFEIFCSYSWFTCFMQGEIWRLISYQFVHAGFGHILFNMWALFFFGPMVEYVMGPRRFLVYYLVCGVAGALFSSLLACLGLFNNADDSFALVQEVNYIAQYVGYEGLVRPWQMFPMVGASAAIYGVMVAVAYLTPSARISLIFPPVTMTMRTFAIVVTAIAVSAVLFNWNNAGGEAGHLGGLIMGAIIMLVWRQVSRYRNRNHWRQW